MYFTSRSGNPQSSNPYSGNRGGKLFPVHKVPKHESRRTSQVGKTRGGEDRGKNLRTPAIDLHAMEKDVTSPCCRGDGSGSLAVD